MKPVWAIGLLALTAACSTTPRNFAPIVAAPVVSDMDLEGATQHCANLVNAGVRTGFREHRAASAAAGVAAGYGAGALVVAGAGSTMAGGAAALIAAGYAMPVVGTVGAIIYSNRVRAGREREIQAAMAACLLEEGIVVDGWERVSG